MLRRWRDPASGGRREGDSRWQSRFFAILAVTIAALIYMRISGREEWMAKAQLVFEQSGSGH